MLALENRLAALAKTYQKDDGTRGMR
eukprot:COSAG02_NODE_50080_length_322_cov_7.524664_1_plen_25_part_10